MQKKLIRVTTVPEALRILLRGQLKFMSDYFEVIGVAADQPALKKVQEEQQIRIKGINMTRKITPFQDIIAIWKLYLLFRKEKPAIVHTHTPKAGFLGMIASWLAGVPVRLHTVAGLPLMVFSGFKMRVLALVEKVTYRFATKVYPNSFKLAEYIVERHFTSLHKIKVIGNGSSNGIDTSYFDPAKYSVETKNILRYSLQFSNDDIVFCYIGRMVRDKGIIELVSKFVEINMHNNKAKLLLVGSFENHLDPLDNTTNELIKNHPDIKWIDFQDDVRSYLSITDIFVFPSYREGFPNVVMQAGAMGIPCIVTDINGSNEIIVHEINGLIIPVKEIISLRGAMERLVEDKILYQTIKTNSRNMIVSRYEQKFIWNLLLEEYKHQLSLHSLT
jgi:glycosyltransferase involved in cell wall biosynthesis